MKKINQPPARFSLPPMPSKRMTKDELIKVVQNVTSLVSRAALAGTLGQTFGGNRDIYEVLGWKKSLMFQDYLDMYERHGLAARIVDALSDESWRCPPVLMDGTVRADNEDANELTPFLTAWNDMVEDLDLWSIFNEVDTALGISRYAVILMGAPGSMDSPLKKAGKLSYLQVYDEGQATITTFDKDANSLRYGMPVMYSITFEDGGMSKPVHYTRVIHCKEGRGRSRVYGVPRLKKPYNYLSDLEKVVGSSSEAFWLLIRKGMILSAQEGQNFPPVGTPEYVTMQEEIQEWEHQLRRVMRLKGVDVTDLGAQVVDGRAQHDVLVADVAGTVGMPQRVFIGSEAGHLASTQDDSNWASVVEARIKQECAKWVKAYYNRQLELSTLPPATSKIKMDFPKLFKMTELEQVQVTKAKVDSINGITGNNPETYIDIEDFIHQEFPEYKVAENPPPEVPPEDSQDNLDEETEGVAPDGAGLEGEQTTQLVEA